MDKNGSYSPPYCRHWIPKVETHNYNALTTLDRKSGVLLPDWKMLNFSYRLPLWILAILAVLLCHLHQAMASPILCPGLCLCSNVTTKNDIYVLSVDCSNGSLSFFDISSHNSLTSNDNVGSNKSQSFYRHGNNSELGFVNKLNITQTNRFVLPESNKTQQSIWYGDLDVNSHKISDTPSDDSHPFITGVILDLSFNNVTSLQAIHLNDWIAVPIVKKINLSNNRIATLDNSSLEFLINLVSLDLSNNHLGIISFHVFRHFYALQYLYLNNNKIVNIQTTGHSFPNLVHLDLSHNNLAGLPTGDFSAFPMLKSLNLSFNNIAWIDPDAFGGLTRLQFLSLAHNLIPSLDYPVFQNTSLTKLVLTDLPHLTILHHTVFKGLTHLQYLNLSHNPRLSFLHPNILSDVNSINVFDFSGTGIKQLSPLTFQNKLELQSVYLNNISLTCQCANAWLVDEIHKNNSIFQISSSLLCRSVGDNKTFPLSDAAFPCEKVLIHNMTNELSVNLGSTLRLQCKQASSPNGEILSWTTPRGRVFYFHHFHPNASQHLLSPKDVQLDAPFHNDHDWHHSSSYYSQLSSDDNRILILSDGSLFIDYMMRSDAGPYTCMVKNAHYNNSETAVVYLVYKISGEVKIIACIVGILCAVSFFTLNVVYVIISWLARHLVNKRRREHISQMLENLNSYKSTQIARIYENYTCQLNRVRNQYHIQRDRLHRNYTMQVDRVKRGCSHQVEKVKDNYNSKLTQLREYSSVQIVQIRDIATTQIGRIRDYGSSQIDRLRETYKFQQQHMLKLLDTLNLDNCRSIVETECMRTESMMYDLDLLSQEDERTESPFSTAESDYNTATSSPVISIGSREQAVALHQGEENTNLHGEGVVLLGVTRIGDNSVTTILNENGGGESNAYKETKESKINKNNIAKNNLGTRDDVEIELNTTLHLPSNIELDAKEVWKYNNENDNMAVQGHTLYTRVNPQKMKYSHLQTNSSTLTDALHPDGNTGQRELEQTNTINAVSLPSIDLNQAETALERSQDSPHLDSAYAQQEASPFKLCLRPPAYFKYEDEEDPPTANLYDADDDEDDEDEEEKTEIDTMV